MKEESVGSKVIGRLEKFTKDLEDAGGDIRKLEGYRITRPTHEGEWGALLQEPCRYCRQQGGMFFLNDEGWEGVAGHQIMRCDLCKRSWQADSATA